MADTNKPSRRSQPINPEAKAFGVITSALEELPTDVVHELPEARLEIGGQVGHDPGLPDRRFDPPPVPVPE
jgi:hypothetical protein